MRAIRITLDNGEIETLITNAGEERIKYEAFKKLYHKRRGIETKYKRLKQRLELENFSGRLAGNIKQDFYAMMTAANIMAHFMRAANREVKKAREESGNQYEYWVNDVKSWNRLTEILCGTSREMNVVRRFEAQ